MKIVAQKAPRSSLFGATSNAHNTTIPLLGSLRSLISSAFLNLVLRVLSFHLPHKKWNDLNVFIYFHNNGMEFAAQCEYLWFKWEKIVKMLIRDERKRERVRAKIHTIECVWLKSSTRFDITRPEKWIKKLRTKTKRGALNVAIDTIDRFNRMQSLHFIIVTLH